MSALGIVAYGVTFPGRYFGLIVVLAVGAFCFSALGPMVATFVPNEDAAPAIINFVIFPVFHLNKLLEAVFNPNASGTGIIASHIAVLLAWGLGALVIAARHFRWEPRHR